MVTLLAVRSVKKRPVKNNRQGDITVLFDNREKNVQQFAKLLVTLDAPSLIGLTRLLKVKVFYDDVKDENGKPVPRSGESIIEDCLVKFHSMNREERRKILTLLKHTKRG